MGKIFNIQRVCTDDGPGIRTTVFLKGCPLNCLWCHNPESKSVKNQLAFYAEKCIHCGACANVCKNHRVDAGSHIILRDNCTLCGKCAEVCNSEALEIIGEEKSVYSVMKEVMKDKDFYDSSKGGMTVSGGEPFLQYGFLLELLKCAKQKGIHTCIESCGYTDREKMAEAAKYTDIFLFDIKETDEKRHIEYTARSNKIILENLFYLDSIGAKTILRCPIIPTLNTREEHYRKIAEIANKLKNVLEINIMPYHTLGTSKAENIGRIYAVKDLKPLSEEEKEKCMETIRKYTSVKVK